MCSVSMIGDHFKDKWQQQPWFSPAQTLPPSQVIHVNPGITRAEFDALKAEVAEMKALLKRAKLYDEQNGEPDCEVDEKMDVLRKVAKLVGVNLDDVIGQSPTT